MIEVSKMNLQFPGGFENRGKSIARKIADRLADNQITRGNLNISHIKLGSIFISENMSDNRIANEVARKIVHRIERNTGAKDE